jgi:hypothetical protein
MKGKTNSASETRYCGRPDIPETEGCCSRGEIYGSRDEDTLYGLGLVSSFQWPERAKHSCFPAKHFRFVTLNECSAHTFVGRANFTESVRPKTLVALSSCDNIGWMSIPIGYFQLENERRHGCFLVAPVFLCGADSESMLFNAELHLPRVVTILCGDSYLNVTRARNRPKGSAWRAG